MKFLQGLHMPLGLGLLLWLVGCSDQERQASQAPMTLELVAEMKAAMGGAEAVDQVRSLIREGSGRRHRLGQIPQAGGEDPAASLEALTEVIDLEGGRAAFDNRIQIDGGFAQHRTEVLTRVDGQPLAWGNTAGRQPQVTTPDGLFSWATQNSPTMLLRRNLFHVIRAMDRVAPGQRAEERVVAGRRYWYGWVEDAGGDMIGLLFDRENSLLAGYLTLDTEPMLGDQDAFYSLGDYRQVDGLLLPFSLEIRKGGSPFASVQYRQISLNDPAVKDWLALPEDLSSQAQQALAAGGSWVPLQWLELAPGVVHVEAFSHNSLVVEFEDYVVVVEGAYTEGQSLRLGRMIEERLGKPIRYVVPTHPHHDHTGGVRALAALGANVLVAAGHEGELRMLVEATHSNPPDALSRRRSERDRVGQVEVFRGSHSLQSGERLLQLFEVSGIPHVEPMVLAYVADVGVLFQSDLFFGVDSPDARALHQAIVNLGLEVDWIAGGHGGVLPFSALEQAVMDEN